MTQPDPTAKGYARLAAELGATPDPDVTATTIVERALSYIPGAQEVSVTIRRHRRPITLASTGDMARRADERQYELDEGPCLDASSTPVSWLRSGDVAHDARWPRWGPRAADEGVGSLISLQLLNHRGPVGAINVYSRLRGAFVETDTVDRATVFAVHAATALTNAALTADLHTALSSRHDIGMAQGIIMERYGLGRDRSFELLQRLSADHQVKLRDIARQITETLVLPAPEEPAAAVDTSGPDQVDQT